MKRLHNNRKDKCLMARYWAYCNDEGIILRIFPTEYLAYIYTGNGNSRKSDNIRPIFLPNNYRFKFPPVTLLP